MTICKIAVVDDTTLGSGARQITQLQQCALRRRIAAC